jgi:DNA/RNA endonuclease G (NUC1)
MKLKKHVAVLGMLASLFAGHAQASIGTTLQMQLGNPSNATTSTTNHAHYLIKRAQYAMDYSDNHGEPLWVSWDLTTGDVGSSGRSSFITDTTLPSGFYQVKTGDYTNSGYDRGHMCPSADRSVTVADNNIVFYMSNIIPQAPDNNQGPWASFEAYCRTLAASGKEVLITSGPATFGGSIPSGVADIGGYTWKIAVVVNAGSGTALSRITSSTRVIALKMPNVQGIRSNAWSSYIVSTNALQTLTGFTFFSAVPSSVATTLRAKVDAGP